MMRRNAQICDGASADETFWRLQCAQATGVVTVGSASYRMFLSMSTLKARVAWSAMEVDMGVIDFCKRVQ
jgi:hypothetical protein